MLTALKIPSYLLAIAIAAFASAQAIPPAAPQLDTSPPFADDPSLVDHLRPLILDAGFDHMSADAILTAVQFQRANWATSSVFADPFYRLPDDLSDAAKSSPGTVLKVEQATNVSTFTIPPKLALSRFLYTTRNVNGTVLPASAFVLWPWMPKLTKAAKNPVIGWAHGTSGVNAECAPSHFQNLWYQWHGLFTLALQGYVVVATDYAGLGLTRSFDGKTIPHQYGANSAAGYDVLFSVQAAQKAWPSLLGDEFVVFGHSQGGGAAWGAAQLQLAEKMPGYLGTVAASPITLYSQYVDNPVVEEPDYQLTFSTVAQTVATIFPDFDLKNWITPAGIQRLQLFEALQGCMAVAVEVYATAAHFLRPNFTRTWEFAAFDNLTSNGARPFAGPMLVIQGNQDAIIPISITEQAVNQTCHLYPESSLNFVVFNDSNHLPVMYAGQQLWSKWIEDRFDGVPARNGCETKTLFSLLPPQQYQPDQNAFLELPKYAYETA